MYVCVCVCEARRPTCLLELRSLEVTSAMFDGADRARRSFFLKEFVYLTHAIKFFCAVLLD